MTDRTFEKYEMKDARKNSKCQLGTGIETLKSLKTILRLEKKCRDLVEILKKSPSPTVRKSSFFAYDIRFMEWKIATFQSMQRMSEGI